LIAYIQCAKYGGEGLGDTLVVMPGKESQSPFMYYSGQLRTGTFAADLYPI